MSHECASCGAHFECELYEQECVCEAHGSDRYCTAACFIRAHDDGLMRQYAPPHVNRDPRIIELMRRFPPWRLYTRNSQPFRVLGVTNQARVFGVELSGNRGQAPPHGYEPDTIQRVDAWSAEHMQQIAQMPIPHTFTRALGYRILAQAAQDHVHVSAARRKYQKNKI